ncbi:hypothetical protein [Brevibacillus fortis]|uniref:Uncharacterized protein n=1 Tax=Brevibacillus fortis TaxID=2126352 RepID=A0A2P7V2N3_9BACL|nr:hypothetical protein [Brevibacillus fortis]PSJ93490.1 hypothetical protein C7R93_18400 [Brevibacillus fortis]
MKVAGILDDGQHKVFDTGAKRIEPQEKGMPISEFMDSALRRIFQYMAGDKQEDHSAAAAWNLNCAIPQSRNFTQTTSDCKK